MDHVADFLDSQSTLLTQNRGLFMQSQSLHLCLTMYTMKMENSRCWGYTPLRFDPFFPDISNESWGDGDSDCVEFQDGDTSRTSEIRVVAMGAFGMMSSRMERFGQGMHAGFILASPETLVLNGDLGPGQTTNIALGDKLLSEFLRLQD